MLHTYLPIPFADATKQQQFDDLRAALLAEIGASTTLLLGNLAVGPAEEVLDAVLIRPHSIVLLLLLPGGGALHIPDFGFSAWRLAGRPLTGSAGADNPFQQFSQQKEALAAWLRPQLPAEAANLNFIGGLALFEQPLVLGPEIEERMSSVPASSSFHLLPNPANCTRRLRQLATPEIDLTPAEITQLAHDLGQQGIDNQPYEAASAYAAEPEPAGPVAQADADPEASQPQHLRPAPANLASPEATQLRRAAGWLWRWLGAEDVSDHDADQLPDDTYSTSAPQAQKEELERLRASMQAELGAQLQALETREKEREHSITQLRRQLTTAPPVTAEAQALQVQLAVENQEKERLEAAMRAASTDLEERNHALDSRIRQLEGLMQQLQQGTPASAGSPSGAASVSASQPTPRLAWPQAKQQLRQWRRYKKQAAMAGAGVLGAGLVWWGVRAATAGPPVPFQEGGRWGYLTAHADTLVPARYTSAGPFEAENRAVVEQNGVFGFLDEEGAEAVPLAYDALQPYAGGYARARIGKLYTFLDLQGQEFNTYYYAARPFSEGKAAVLDRRGWFYITGLEEAAKEPVIFQEAYAFREELARVKRNGHYTFITEDYLDDPTEGTEPFGAYESAADFVEGRARVTQQGRTFYIDTDADEVK
ncbi:WG repeat-containing protein [Hymenobacter canadensis]|uniref:WG repeat-containing protein n=1 Tax=Hymenobacter canadensis TaxID=2999067 RepID=A0ABY7LQ37_9BACT|nr:WG repeat-containing protein [Hymenobacter canadensis]WBA40830.1 WG repeat-containing protein [Hymenobacter canadensis]